MFLTVRANSKANIIPKKISTILKGLFENIRIEIQIKNDKPPTSEDTPIRIKEKVLRGLDSNPKNLNSKTETTNTGIEINQTFFRNFTFGLGVFTASC